MWGVRHRFRSEEETVGAAPASVGHGQGPPGEEEDSAGDRRKQAALASPYRVPPTPVPHCLLPPPS